MTSHLKTRETASVPLEVKAEGENGTFEGYGAIFGNLDRDGDVVSRGAFSESLKGRMPALLWQHNAKEPIGRFDVVREDAKGLYVKGRLSMEGRGREAYDLLKMGALDGLSIGFVTKEASRNATTGARTITKADLMEISLVTFPANELARVSTVKSSGPNLETPRGFERFLRESGFSRSRAKAITAKGFGACLPAEVAADEESALAEELRHKRLQLMRKMNPAVAVVRSLDELMSKVIGAYRAVAGSPQPFMMEEGGSSKVSLGLRGLGNRTVSVGIPRAPGFHYWKWDLKYWRLDSHRGPVVDTERLKFDGRQLVDSATLSLGSESAWESWFKRELKDKSAEEVISKIGAFLNNPAPQGIFTYTKFFLPEPMDTGRKLNGGVWFKINVR